MIVLSVVIAAVCAAALLPVLSDLWSLVGSRRREPADRGALLTMPRLLFLVPAHDEELLIAKTVRSLHRMEYPVDHRRIVVIADNCSDATATIARREGAESLERLDRERRGKPWAIRWALEQLRLEETDAVIIIDADAVVAPSFARELARAAPLSEKACQTYNDVSNPGENALTRMAAVFSTVRARLMNEVKHRAGLNVPLANGLCLGTGVIARHGWNAFSICEDWEMYAILTAAGERIDNVPAARVFAQEARTLEQGASQRKRWAAGKLVVLRRYAGVILRSPRISVHQKVDALAELVMPGPAVQLGASVVLAGVSVALALPGSAWIVSALMLSLARLTIYSAIAASREAEPRKAFLAFGFLPFYTVWRLAIQVAALRMVGEKPWVRTQRHHSGPNVGGTETPERQPSSVTP